MASPKFIAQGVNGCVYSGITCINDDDIRASKKQYITKVLNIENGAKEYCEYKNLEKLLESTGVKDIDNYFIYKSSVCNPDPSIVIDEKKCKQKPAYMYLSYENGGKDLETILEERSEEFGEYNYEEVKTPKGPTSKKTFDFEGTCIKPLPEFYKNLFISFLNIFKGIDILNSHGIYCFDLKPANIVYNEKTGMCKMIDLGSCTKPDLMSEKDLKYLIENGAKGTIPYLPPEMKILPTSTGKVLYLPGFYNFRLVELKKKDNQLELMYHETQLNTIDLEYYSNVGVENKEDNREILLQRCKKMNIWILGVILLEIYDQIIDEMKKEDYKKGCRIGELELLMPLINQLLALNVDERLDSTQALSEYKEWLKNLTKQSSPRVSPETVSLKPGTKFLKPGTVFLKPGTASEHSFITPSPTPSPTTLFPSVKTLGTGGSLYKKTRRYKLKKGRKITNRKKHIKQIKSNRKYLGKKRYNKHISLRKLRK
jgi:serine/threonine protein kinase